MRSVFDHIVKRKSNYFISCFLFAFCISGYGGGVKTPKHQNQIRFTENKSQWEPHVLFRAQLDGGLLFLEKNCFTYNFYDKEALRKNHIKKESKGLLKPVKSHAFRMTFLNALTNPELISKNETPDYCNFFIGNDKTKWAGNVKNYKEVYYKGLYNGIDIQILGNENSIKYNFYVAPNANPNNIQLFYEGLSKISLEKKNLRIKTSLNEIVEEKPYAYQLINGKKIEVPCEFVLKNNTVHFNFPKGYNKQIELVIDPILVFACSSGSIADNFGMTATYDDAGNLYGGGTVYGVGYPVTLGVYDETWNGAATYLSGRTDVVITKYDSSGTFLQYSTYLGGSTNTEIVSSLIVNSQNELMLFGATGSSDFPVTSNAYDTSFNSGAYLVFWANGTEYANGTDLYLAKFNSTGTSLLASTFIGGSDNEGANSSTSLAYNYGDYYRGEIQVDNIGNAYVASCTFSPDFPTTPGSMQPAPGGGMDGVVFKMNSDFSSLLWSTYVGGSADDGCYALTLDNLQNVYTTGGTMSSNFQVTPGAYSTTYNGGVTDGFVMKIKDDGTTVLNSTYIGTASYDQCFLIQLDNTYNVYIVGQSLGVMPVSSGVYSNPNSKQFIWKMDNNLSTQLITTIFGNGNGQVNISPSAFLVDICGNIYVCGWGGNILTGVPTTGMPVTAGAFQPGTDGFNFYLTVLTPDASSLLYGTYFGGGISQEHVDGGTSRFDKKGIVYHAVCAGCGGQDDFPVTPGSWPNTGADVNHNTQNNNCNMGVFKFDFQAAGVNAEAMISPNDTICVGDTVFFNNTSSNALNYLWDFGDGSPVSGAYSPVHFYNNPGTYNITLIAIDSTGCIFSDTSNLSIIVAPIPVVNLGSDLILCQTPNVSLDAGTSGSIYLWSTGDTTQTITAVSAGEYNVIISNGNCEASDSISIQEIILLPDIGNDTLLCDGQTIVLNASFPGVSYLWSTGDTTSSIEIFSAGQYWVTITSGPCNASDTVNVNYLLYPVINFPPDVIICPDDSLLLNGGAPATSYLWSTGDTTQTIYIDLSGTYFVTATNGHCSALDTTTAAQVIFPALGNDTTMCTGQTALLDVFMSGASYLWSTGAGTASITVSSAGQYWVKITYGICQNYDTINVNYLSYPVVNIPSDITICEDDSVFLDPGSGAISYLWSTGDTTQTIYASNTGMYIITAFNQQCFRSDTTVIQEVVVPPLGGDTVLCTDQTIVLNAIYPGATYQWSTGATSSFITVATPGQYWVITNFSFCQKKDTINIGYIPYPEVSLTTIESICPNTSITLDAGNNSTTAYFWSTGDTTQTINVSAGGTYSVTVFNSQCAVSDTTEINAIPEIGWDKSITLCNVEKYTLTAGEGSAYLWSTGDTSPTLEVFEAGEYWVSVNTAACVLRDTITVEGSLGYGSIWFPNSFTPNENGLNDFFTGKGSDITYFSLMIFNRWGELIFQTEDIDKGWNGFYKGRLAELDVYVWKVKYKTKCTDNKMNEKIGHVTVVR